MPEGETGLDAAGIEARLRQPLVPRQDGVFRLGLALNGAAASGAWTAGALDFLVEALDLWDDKKRRDRERGDGRATVPDHELRVGIAGGASGGGICAALLARAAPWDFPHATDAEAVANAANPFWRVWVECLDIAPMLDASDLSSPGAVPASLLSGAAMEAVGGVIRGWSGEAAALRPRRRGWLADPFRVLLALTNLRGVPYRIEFGADGGGRERASHYLDHADHALFAFAADSGRDAASLGLRGDEHLVGDAAGWERFAEFAKATAAIPAGFPARRLSRPTADYDWRGVVLPGEGWQSPPLVRLRHPDWGALDPPVRHDLPYWFDCVDGGALDNRPVELVRAALAGLGGSNPRGPKEAHTTVLLLDPCAAVPRCDPPPAASPCDLLGVFSGLAASWTDGGRFSAADLLLALEPGVASRFLLTARREREGKPRHGAAALATAGMGGFLGFLRRELRVHDYMMGRENCRYFLMHEFVLHEENPVFRGFASRHPAAAEEYRPHPGQSGWLPIVPVAEHLRVPRLLPHWPRRALDPGRLAEPMQERCALLLRRLLDGNGLDLPMDGLLADWVTARKLAGAAEERIRRAMASGALG
jgi:Patatin-like phospholipase